MAKKAADEGPRKFGVYQNETGSYTLGDARFTPLAAVPVSVETAEAACEDTSPVKFFDSEDDAKKNVEALTAKFAARKPKKG